MITFVVFVLVLACNELPFGDDWRADVGDVLRSPTGPVPQQSFSSKGYHFQWHGERNVFNINIIVYCANPKTVNTLI